MVGEYDKVQGYPGEGAQLDQRHKGGENSETCAVRHCVKQGTMRLESTTKFKSYPAWGELPDQDIKGEMCLSKTQQKAPPTRVTLRLTL